MTIFPWEDYVANITSTFYEVHPEVATSQDAAYMVEAMAEAILSLRPQLTPMAQAAHDRMVAERKRKLERARAILREAGELP